MSMIKIVKESAETIRQTMESYPAQDYAFCVILDGGEYRFRPDRIDELLVLAAIAVAVPDSYILVEDEAIPGWPWMRGGSFASHFTPPAVIFPVHASFEEAEDGKVTHATFTFEDFEILKRVVAEAAIPWGWDYRSIHQIDPFMEALRWQATHNAGATCARNEYVTESGRVISVCERESHADNGDIYYEVNIDFGEEGSYNWAMLWARLAARANFAALLPNRGEEGDES